MRCSSPPQRVRRLDAISFPHALGSTRGLDAAEDSGLISSPRTGSSSVIRSFVPAVYHAAAARSGQAAHRALAESFGAGRSTIGAHGTSPRLDILIPPTRWSRPAGPGGARGRRASGGSCPAAAITLERAARLTRATRRRAGDSSRRPTPSDGGPCRRRTKLLDEALGSETTQPLCARGSSILRSNHDPVRFAEGGPRLLAEAKRLRCRGRPEKLHSCSTEAAWAASMAAVHRRRARDGAASASRALRMPAASPSSTSPHTRLARS